ncbi:MAG: hypothetical protein K8S21_12825 [Gemmatimonadetes bacterium]|nr:hypothetical protein [Gemmatimonadota bacterium]
MSIRYLRLALILAFAAPALEAQQAGGMSHDHPAAKPALDAELAEHFKGIALTDAQIRQVTEIKAKHHAAMEELRRGAADQNAPARKAEVQKHMDAEHAEFMALLTEGQRKVFEANMKEHHAPAPGAKPMPEGMMHGMDHGTKALPAPPTPAPTRRP